MKKFIGYDQSQLAILPLDLGELIAENHLSRVINRFVDELPVEIFRKAFPEKDGRPAYNPKLMLKIVLYAYSTKLYSSRKIELALKQDITFMWLSAMQCPDHNTINRFRSQYLKEILSDIFTELLDFLHTQGYIKFESYFVDGTKIEADANKFSYVWKKSILRYKESLNQKVKQLLKEIDELNLKEDQIYSSQEKDADHNISSDQIKEVAEKVKQRLKEKQNLDNARERELKSAGKKLEKHAEKMQEYETKEKLLGQRNSYSKTDTDASFLRMKNDELKPGYNLQVSSENQFIVNYTVSQHAADTSAFPDHVDAIQEKGEKYIPENYVGDAGYGSEENYEKLKKLGSESYLKYNTFNTELKGKSPDNWNKTKMIYHQQGDYYVCPNGEKITFARNSTNTTQRGYVSNVKEYECSNCNGCKFNQDCNNSKGKKILKVRPNLDTLKKQTFENLTSSKGIELSKRRGWEIETFFGDLKMNQGYRRIRLRGLAKATLELAYHSITYNLRKMCILQNKTQNFANI
jgi:transposase